MRRKSGQRRNRWAAWAAALLVHGVLIQALLHLPGPPSRAALLERLTLLNLSPPRPAAAEPEPVPGPARSHRTSRVPPTEATHASGNAPATVIPAPVAPPTSIDWAAEQQRAAASKGEEIWRQLAPHCRDQAALHIYPPECHRYVAPDPWEPEEKRFGMEGPLPFVRLGRCVVGLGFWGCAVGKPPPPNGHVFDGMRDPDRPGAVPDNGGYQAPPEAHEPLH